MKLNLLVFIETFVILILIVFLVIMLMQNAKLEKAKKGYGLLSSRIYAGLLEPKTYLIFNFDPLKANLSEFIEKNRLNVSVYILNLRDGASMGINQERLFYPMSLNKVLLAILILRKIEGGELNFDTMVPVREGDRDPNDLHPIRENELPIRQVFELMLKESSNTAAAMLKHYIAKDDISFFLFYLSYSKKYQLSEEDRTIQPDMVDVYSIANVFSSLYFSTLLEPENSEYLLSLLTETVFDVKNVANLPKDIIVAHKFGNRHNDRAIEFSDCGILYFTDHRRIFYCVFTDGLDTEEAVETIGLIINRIYNYVEKIPLHLQDPDHSFSQNLDR